MTERNKTEKKMEEEKEDLNVRWERGSFILIPSFRLFFQEKEINFESILNQFFPKFFHFRLFLNFFNILILN